jgi:hypothetical protein
MYLSNYVHLCASELTQPNIVVSGKQIISALSSFAWRTAFSIRTKLPARSPSSENIWHIAIVIVFIRVKRRVCQSLLSNKKHLRAFYSYITLYEIMFLLQWLKLIKCERIIRNLKFIRRAKVQRRSSCQDRCRNRMILCG